jgi:hypothetical protein
MLFADIYDIIMTPVIGPVVAIGIGVGALLFCFTVFNKLFGGRE